MFKKKHSVNYLEIVPVQNVPDFIEENGKIILLIPKFKNKWLLKWFIPPKRSKVFRIKLDILGSAVWKATDGNRTIAEISQILSENKELNLLAETHLEERLTNFISQLYKSRFVVFKGM